MRWSYALLGAALAFAYQPLAMAEELRVSLQVMQCVKQYSARTSSRLGWLYISADGRYCNWWYCPSHRCDNQMDLRRGAEGDCRSASGQDCLLVAKSNEFQYELVVETSSSTASAETPPSASFNAEPLGDDVRDLSFYWENRYGALFGRMAVGDGSGGPFTIDLPDNDGSCQGTYRLSTRSQGVWSMSCTNGLAASGEYKALGRGKGARGWGQDSQGNKVEYRIGTAQ